MSGPRRAAFRAFECRPGGALEEADWALEPNGDGWTVLREGRPHVALGAGYRLLRTAVCGVCSTDLDRHFLPFPLPQVIGHEVVVLDGDGRRHVVEINASPGARGLAAECPDCRAGLGRHCPKRLVLGIHDLPGGFGAYVLAPAHAVLPVPDAVPTETAALVEPFAAALRATEVLALDRHASVAVLGPRRLGMLVIAALAAERRRRGLGFGLTAIVRRRELAPLARELGADTVVVSADAAETLGEGAFDAVVDTTGTPEGFDAALRLARCEVHLKSTNGRPAGGLGQATALVVDELRIARLPEALPVEDGSRVAWLARAEPPAGQGGRVVRLDRDAAPGEGIEPFPAAPGGCITGAACAVVDDLADADFAIRPIPGSEASLLRPCGTVYLTGARRADPPLARAIVARGLTLSSSRCGDFRRALALLEQDPRLAELGERFVSHVVPAAELPRAFDLARSPASVKVLVEHPG